MKRQGGDEEVREMKRLAYFYKEINERQSNTKAYCLPFILNNQ
jgi:hypothetical protein